MGVNIRRLVQKLQTAVQSTEPAERQTAEELERLSAFLSNFLENGYMVRQRNHIRRTDTKDFARSPNSKKRAATNLYVRLSEFQATLKRLSHFEAKFRAFVESLSNQMIMVHKVGKVGDLPKRDKKSIEDVASFTLKDTLKQLEIILAKIQVMYLKVPLKDSEKSRINLHMALYKLKNDSNRQAGDLRGFINMVNAFIKDLQGM